MLIESASLLVDHKIYLDFSFSNILFSPLKKKQLYWGNVKEDNSHRSFYRASERKILSSKEGLSPEEMKSLLKQYLWF